MGDPELGMGSSEPFAHRNGSCPQETSTEAVSRKGWWSSSLPLAVRVHLRPVNFTTCKIPLRRDQAEEGSGHLAGDRLWNQGPWAEALGQSHLWAPALDLFWGHKEVGHQEEHVLSLEEKCQRGSLLPVPHPRGQKLAARLVQGGGPRSIRSSALSPRKMPPVWQARLLHGDPAEGLCQPDPGTARAAVRAVRKWNEQEGGAGGSSGPDVDTGGRHWRTRGRAGGGGRFPV